MAESEMRQALDNWLQRQGASVMRQEMLVCDAIPPHTKDAMINISTKSAAKEREMGAPITQDYTLGNVLTGTMEQVPVPRPAGTIGTYHTHPFGWAKPSTYDMLEALNKDDKIMCIGASGKIGTKIACFTPKEPKWSELGYKSRLLADDINHVQLISIENYR